MPCFTTGVRIETPDGLVPVEALRVGGTVVTRDHGVQKIRWIGTAKRLALGNCTPIRIAAGALGQGLPARDLIVSPQHRMLVNSTIAKRVAGAQEILVAAKKLLGLPGIGYAQDKVTVTYYHLLLDVHEVIYAEGAPTESLMTGPMARQALGCDALAEIEDLFPELMYSASHPARVIPRGKLVREMLQRHVKNDKPLLAA